MNKWWVRFWGIVALASLAAMVASTVWSATPAAMSGSHPEGWRP